MLSIKKNITGYSNEIDQIISKQPPWIVRWGNLLLIAVLVMLVAACWFIRYTDTVKFDVKINIAILQDGSAINFAEGYLPMRAAKNVQPGSYAAIIPDCIDATVYPPLAGRIDSMSIKKEKAGYYVKILLTSAADKNLLKKIQAGGLLHGTCEISLPNQRLLLRLYDATVR